MDHPFKPGVEVAIVSGYASGGYTLSKVLKVHKNGNFTLESDAAQQWKPYRYADNPWFANRNGERFSRFTSTVRLADDEFKAEQTAAKAKGETRSDPARA